MEPVAQLDADARSAGVCQCRSTGIRVGGKLSRGRGGGFIVGGLGAPWIIVEFLITILSLHNVCCEDYRLF